VQRSEAVPIGVVDVITKDPFGSLMTVFSNKSIPIGRREVLIPPFGESALFVTVHDIAHLRTRVIERHADDD
jgi:hypothetical protein